MKNTDEISLTIFVLCILYPPFDTITQNKIEFTKAFITIVYHEQPCLSHRFYTTFPTLPLGRSTLTKKVTP